MRDFIKKILVLFTILFMSIPSAITGSFISSVKAEENNPLNIETRRIDEHTTITQNGCYRKIEKTDATDWSVPRKPIDLVILQDASGSFRTTIPSVKRALKRLTTYVSPEQYDETNPYLVKTDDPRTTDRVFVASYQGLDQVRYFENNDFSGSPANVYTDANSTGKNYTYGNSGLTSDQNKVHSFIDNIAVDGGTPTVPAIDDTIAQYNRVKGNMENGRKTVFLLVTDGVANGYRLPGSNTVVMDKSWTRTDAIQKAWGVDSYPEAAQDITGRANELKAAGNQLKAAVGSEGSVVVGFWERVDNFTEKYYQYGPAYLNGFGNTINIGDNRSVQAIFHDALQSMASPDKVVNGKNVSFYVNEQNNIDVFSQKILESVAAALVKDDITGEFDITEGYKVDAIRINGKKIVPKVKDSSKEIRGTITQTGNKVKISVPDSVFNPGKNSFDYDLSKEARAPETNEEDETDPPANYVPEKEEITVPELTGKFKAGEFETRQIGGRNQTVEVQKLEYCYPSATKTVADQDASNDIGVIPDPLELTKKPSYSAQLSSKGEEFTYTVNYNFNNVPYEFEKNVMLTDPIDYRLEVVSHSATGPEGQAWKTRVVEQADSDGNMRSVVVADVPSEGKNYNYLIMKKAQLRMTVRLKEKYRQNQASKEYLAILQNNNGYGLVNQGNIMWNGEDNTPNQDAHAKTDTKASTIRRSNPIYVKPPLDTEVDKKVNEKEHEGLRMDGEEFEYKVTAPWPGIADKFTLTDTVVDELEIQPGSAKVSVAGKSYTALTKAISINGQTIDITLDKTQLTSLNRLISRRGGNTVQEIELTFKAKIREGADLTKYKKNGVVNIPNTADVILNDKKKTSKEVTVTPPKPKEPSVGKKINESLDDYQTFDGQPYNYNITAAVPSDAASYKKFVISDTLDNDLEFAGDVTIKGEAAALFDIQKNGQTVTATVKEGKFQDLAKYSYIELQIPAKVKNGVSGRVIENKARINFTNENNQEKEVESNPVRVTPPPVSKKINENLDHLDIATGQLYKYNIKTSLPTDIKDYKKFVITDKLDKDLSVVNETDNKPVIQGAAANFFDVTVEGQTVTATMKDFANAGALAGQEVELVIPAKINDGVTRSNIPNTATFSFTDKNDHNGEKETIPVTVTPPTEPSVSKKINEKLDEATIAASTDFNYNVKSKLPNDITTYKSYVISDTLDENLEAGKAVIKGDAAKFFDVTVAGNTVTATMKDFARAEDLANKEVELVITAKVKKESTVPVIENKAKVTYTNKNDQGGEKETEPVRVTPPPVSKKVNNQEHADLGSLRETFNYDVESKIPDVADKFEISDELVPELTFDGQATVQIDGKEVKDATVKTAGQKLTVTFEKDQIAAYAGKTVRVHFGAKIKDGVSYDALLAKYPNDTGDKPAVPNKASYQVNDNPDSKKETSPVTVTPPPTTTPDLKKEVNGADHYDLSKRDEEFTYTLKTEMPANSTVFEITDELKSVLEFVGKKGSATVKIDGKDAGDKATVTVKDQLIKIEFTEASVKADAGKSIEVNFKAKIRKGVSLVDYMVPNEGIRIMNKASYVIDNNPKYRKDSNEVPVTPPNPEQPPIEKTVNDKASETLTNRNDVFTYKVKTTVPFDATSFSVDDEIKDVLEFADAGSATLDGQALAADRISINGQKITVSLTEDQVKANGGKEVILSFQAKIRENANLSAYVTKDNKTEIPNQASYDASFPHQPGVHKDSNIVPVTPPSPEQPEIKKDVNGKEEETLSNRNDEFTYHVTTKVPLDATAFSVMDELEGVLEFAEGTGRATASLNGQPLDSDRISINGQTITVSLTEEQVKANGGKEVSLSFAAKIREGANLSSYKKKDKTEIPNKATYRVDFPNNPGVTKDSNIVPVTPPSPENPPIEKKVNDAASATLSDRGEEFTYTIDTQVPLDVTGFAVYDTIEKVLEFSGENGQASATVDGQALDSSHIEIKGQKITVKLTEAEAKAHGGKSVHVSFKAKIKEGANLSEYIEKDGVTRIQNTAKYNFNNDPGTEQSSKPVPVTPPTPNEPEIKKDVNGKPEETLANREDSFTYHVNTSVPVDATAFEVHDSLVDVLSFVGQASASLNGEALDAKQIKVDGQTITLTLTEEQVKANGGKAVNLTFDAKIREGANLSGYFKDDKIQVPNKATYRIGFPNRPGVTKDSNEVPVTPPTPEQPPLEKDVNKKASETIEDRTETFTYNLKTSMPWDATAFTISDELKDVLEFVGQATVTLDGKATDAQVTTNGQLLEVNFPEATVKANGGKKIQVSFKAKIKADADLTPYLVDNQFTVPNTASYVIDNNPGTKKDSNPVPVIVPKQPEPEITKKINRTLDHLDVDRGVPYMYNVNTQLPKDIRLYKEFTVTDTLESVLEVAGTPVAYIDGYATDAIETKVEGNTVTVSVKDFARIHGFKEIQLYIPAKIKSDVSDEALNAYENRTVPNKATVAFKDSNGQTGNKESNPVTVRPRDPEKPRDPDPNEPVKTVGPADGSNPTIDTHRLTNISDEFRFDITTKVPSNPVDDAGNPVQDAQGRDVKTELTGVTVTDKIDNVLKINRVALKIEDDKVADVTARLQTKLDKAEADLKELESKTTNDTVAKKVQEAEKKVQELTAQLEAAKAAAATATPAPTTPASSDSSSSDPAASSDAASTSDTASTSSSAASTNTSADVAALEASLKAAQAELEQLKAEAANVGNLATPEEQKVAKEKLDKEIAQLKESKEKLAKALEQFKSVTDKGELTDEALAKVAKVTVNGQDVTVDITDKDILEALKGSTLRVVIYSVFKEGVDPSQYQGGVPNKAYVNFNHDPKIHETNIVRVVPPTPTPEPPAPKDDLPPAPTPEPPKPKKILPKTGTSATMVYEVIVGLVLVLMGALLRRRKTKH
ncbi:isopeptide-forming domain-containing fimbrial protein [Streptococcus sanguinis]